MNFTANVPLKPFDIMAEMIHDPATSWSVGTFGALAEFSYVPEDRPRITSTPQTLTVITERGALQIQAHPKLRLCPYEGLSSLENAWTQGVLVCLSSRDATLNNRSGLFETGPDTQALSDDEPNQVLFDLGLGVPHLDACIRTDNPELIQRLRSASGASLFDPSLGLVAALLEANPTRVFLSKISRIEVHQPIPDDQGTSPDGPHTHLSEKLLAHQQTQAATIPLPDGWVPVLAFFPPNPVRDGAGNLRPFDSRAHQRFQALLKTFGPAELTQVKQGFLDAMANQTEPEHFHQPTSKSERTSLRIAIRQYALQFPASLLLSRWQAFYEPTRRQ